MSSAAETDQLTWREDVRADLVGNVLPFWAGVAPDGVRGGFHGRIANDGTIDDSVPRSAVLCTRVLWAFSAAARHLADASWLATADHAYDYLLANFVDADFGGVFWSVDADGAVVSDRKQIYAQAFAIYALAEYARASGRTEPLTRAQELFELVEAHGFDPEFGGYYEARGRDWAPIDDVRLSPRDLNAPKSMNTVLHVMEAYTTLAGVTGDERVTDALAGLVQVILDHVVDAERGRFRLFFERDFTSLVEVTSYGHDIEGAWLLTDAARAVGDPDLVARAEAAAVAMADAVVRYGREPDGAIAYEFVPATGVQPAHRDGASHWWVQAEGAVGLLEAHRLTGDPRFLAAAADCWRVITAHHIAPVGGDWFKVLEADRSPRNQIPKVGPWECPYHHVRACLQLLDRLPTPTRETT